MSTDISICNQALIMIGATKISSFDDGTTEAIACETLYEDTVKDTLGLYRWRFASGMEQLSRLAAAPSTKWDAAYQLPTKCLMPSTVYIAGNPINFDIYEDMVFCNAASTDTVVLEGIYRVDESFWPPFFVQLIVYRMASLLAHSIGGQVDTAELLDRRATRHAAIARNRDAQGRTAPRIDTSRIINSRYRNARNTS